jgi:uncharacterized protein (TIGR02266 family)
MSEDTRKDPRTKFVSLNVRFKSATVDEFIENHSYDVSKGGIFIKTNSPFASGTLLKFEIRLAADEPVIAGVGRVVWKREAAQSAAERPAGMGVKFIKVDEASKAVIDRLVSAHADAGAAFEGGETGDKKPAPAAAVPAPIAGASAARPITAGGPVVKKTMMGLGAVPGPGKSPSATMSKTVPQSPVAKKPSGDFFPKTNSEADMPPPEERTVMKQAAELLEEALKEAGGSMDEVGKIAPAPAPKPAEPEPPPLSEEKADEKPEPVAATPAGETPAPAPASEKPSVTEATPKPAAAKAVSSFEEEEPKKKGSGALMWAALVVLVGVGLFGAYKMNVFGTTPVTTAPTVPPPPSASVAPSASESTSTTAPSASVAAPTLSDAAAPDAGRDAAPTVTATVTATQPTFTATARPTATVTATATATATATTTTTATATATGVATGTATATATATAPKPTATATATAPKPKPTSTDDNPY